MSATLSVAQLNVYLKSLLDGEQMLRGIFVRGEISNFTRNFKSGHLYFSLKEGTSGIKCVMFASDAARLKFTPCDGMAAVVYGRVTLYERDGCCQLYAQQISPDGEGAARMALQKLYERLSADGLFDERRKLPLPKFPQSAVLISSASGAATQDVLSIWRRRWPLCDLKLIPVSVQGESAPQQIADALGSSQCAAADVVIVARGGGSAEDLWIFNDERVVRAVAGAGVPVISAVGHQTDNTLCDLAASCRAATPSAAAELAFPDINAVLSSVNGSLSRIKSLFSAVVSEKERRLAAGLAFNAVFPSRITGESDRVKSVEKSLRMSLSGLVSEKENVFASECARLETLSPLAVLLRGYCIAADGERVLTTAAAARTAKKLTLRFHDGVIGCKTYTEVSQ